MKPLESVFVKSVNVSCSGSKDSSPHPLVYLKIKGEGVSCPYCGKYFILENKESDRVNLLKKSN